MSEKLATTDGETAVGESRWRRFQRWGRTPLGHGILFIALMVLIAATFGFPKVFGVTDHSGKRQLPSEENFVSVTTSRWDSGDMGRTGDDARRALFGTWDNPTVVGQRTINKIRDWRQNILGTGKLGCNPVIWGAICGVPAPDFPSPKDLFQGLMTNFGCNAYAPDFSDWNGQRCKLVNGAEAIVQDTATVAINCAIVGAGGDVLIKGITGEFKYKEVIKDPGGAIRIIFPKAGGVFAAGIGVCVAQNYFHIIPQIGKK